MGKSFRSEDLNQALLLPPSLHDWLPEKHLARCLVDVVEPLDLSAIYASYEAKDGRGQAAYAPEMMLRGLLYGYSTGVYSSRKIESRTYEDVAFRFLSAGQQLDHDTIDAAEDAQYGKAASCRLAASNFDPQPISCNNSIGLHQPRQIQRKSLRRWRDRWSRPPSRP
jgi:hypothetical protein